MKWLINVWMNERMGCLIIKWSNEWTNERMNGLIDWLGEWNGWCVKRMFNDNRFGDGWMDYWQAMDWWVNRLNEGFSDGLIEGWMDWMLMDE